jgi:FlaA1/EpsC-like NDP-sugar epimerase
MGEPVRISEVAWLMIAASGRPIEIVYTGLRPGEKVTEELVGDNDWDSERTVHPQISAVTIPTLRFDELGDLQQDRSAIAIRTRLAELCRRQTLPPVAESPRVRDSRHVVEHAVGL